MESGESRVVQHFHYTTWPDFGVPQSPAAFLTFLLAVRSAGVLEENVGPPVVHCSAGIGRSGTFCLVDTCLVLIEQSNDIDSVNIKEVLLEMRRYRMGLIQTPDQLRFSYLAIIEGGKHVLAGTFSENMLMKEEEESTTSLGGSSLTESRSSECMPPPLPPRIRNAENDDSLHGGANHVASTLDGYKDNILSEVETRKRARKDRVTKTAEKVEQMKRRQKESETWQKRRCRRSHDHESKPYPERSPSKVHRSRAHRPFQRT